MLKHPDLELKLAEGSELLRNSILADGMTIKEERQKSGRLLLRCSKHNKLFNASLALDTLGWRLSIISNNGILENATFKVNNCTTTGLKKLIERAGLKIVLIAKPIIEDKPLPNVLEFKLKEKRVSYERNSKEMTVKDVLQKVKND